MKKWIPNETLNEEPSPEEANSFQKMIFGLSEESAIKDPVTKEEMEVICDIAKLDDGSYVMRFSVDEEEKTFKDEFDDKFYVEKSYNIDVPIEVIGDPRDYQNSQVLFDVDKGIDVYRNTKIYDSTYLHEKKDELISEEKDAIPDAIEKDFKKFANNLDKSIREVGFDVFDTNIVKNDVKEEVSIESKKPKKPKNDSPSP